MATLRQLKTFLAVAEYKNMSIAAQKLFISQPTVSQMISELEKEYKVKLFERFPKGLKITTAGKILLSHAQEFIMLQEKMEQSMKNIQKNRPLRIGATLSIGSTILGDIICRMQEQYPDIHSTVCVDNTKKMEQHLLHNELDIALVEGIISKSELVSEPVITDQLTIICGKKHPFAEKREITLEMLRNQDFILREKGSGTRAIFENLMARNKIPYSIRWESSCNTAVINAVKHNLGLGIVSYRCVEKDILSQQLIECHAKDVSMNRFFYLCYCKNRTVSSQMLDFILMVQNSPEYNNAIL